MKYRLTLSPEAAALLDELYESGKLADIGVTALTEAKDEEAEAEAEEQALLPAQEVLAQLLVVSSIVAHDTIPRSEMTQECYHIKCHINHASVLWDDLLIRSASGNRWEYFPMRSGFGIWRISERYCLFKGKYLAHSLPNECIVRMTADDSSPPRPGDIIEIIAP